MKGSLLSLNAGSSRMKFALFDAANDLTATARGEIDDLTSAPHLTARDGPVMATRRGLLDPGAILYLGRQGHGFADIEDMLYRRSGLLGVSGISGDIRVLLASEDPHAREAIELLAYRIATEAGAPTSALGGLDGLVFTAGIGEHAPAIRSAICGRLGWLGLRLDDAANAAGADRISASDSAIEVRVMATDEEATIAHRTLAAIRRARTCQGLRS